MTQKTSNIVLPTLLGCLIGLVVYIYQDYKTENKQNIQDIRRLIEVIQSNQVDQRIANERINNELSDHDKRITSIELCAKKKNVVLP